MSGGYAAAYLPWILIPIICWFLPLVVSALAFIYIESDT